MRLYSYKKLYTAMLLTVVSHLVFASDSTEDKIVTILTDNIPPFTYQNEEGEFVGSSDLLIKTLFNKAKLNYEVKSLPWKRALQEFQQVHDSLIFPITRIKERENLYHWIAPLFSVDFKLYGLRKKYENKSIDIASGDYSFVCVSITYVCTILRKLNIPESSISSISSVNAKQMVKMVHSGRVDFLILPDIEFDYARKELDLPAEQFVSLKNRNYKLVDYIVAKSTLNSDVVKKLKLAAESLDLEID